VLKFELCLLDDNLVEREEAGEANSYIVDNGE
jgi:hypothetical protein